ncbi:MAG TPA: S41 family peptidase [Chitinophagaceae bacterium]|nr:S41 family peptidase [Chitinophagaceae bacterium]
MKKIIALLSLCYCCSALAQPVDSLRHIVDISIDKMQQHALHRKEVDWVSFKQKVYERTKGISNMDTLLSRFPEFFKWINDYHGGVVTPTRWIKWREGKPPRPVNAMVDSVLDYGPRLRVDRFGDVGYFRVPSVGGLEDEIPARTQRLADTLCKIDPATAKGWIIDLRVNTGGNIWPMITTLATLIGDGNTAGLKYLDGKPDVMDFIKDGKPFGNNQFYSIPKKTCELPASNLPVVVLTSPATGSSGESLLLAFKGRPNTVILGETTAGYTTSNNNYQLQKDLYLFLATAYMQDRNGKIYPEGITPDIMVKDGDDLYDLKRDLKVQQALKWLSQHMRN